MPPDTETSHTEETDGPADGHPRYTKPPVRLTDADLGLTVDLAPARGCAFCGHFIEVARVVRLDERRYAYACLGCAKHIPGAGPDRGKRREDPT